ncbi:hypothetical protein [Brevibacillus fulvus]|uniref:Uncharacterized protein n=1 Tax=Brevibacillus fulvus TaxID=1125967 RepID=A0A938XXH6_9BACL|nr:hypothetical protein [Brevibacillus fulvus]MBM7592313.1 hypothetical protein [Brevibacillus fulvus]
MTKLISVLALMVIVLPISVTVLFDGPNNLFGACRLFFQRLFEHVVWYGAS